MMIRVILPFHLRTLAHVGSEVTLEVEGPVTQRSVLDVGIVRKARPTIPQPEGAKYCSPGREPWVGLETSESRRDDRNKICPRLDLSPLRGS